MTDEVRRLRRRIDRANELVSRALAERQRAVEAVCAVKARAGVPVRDPAREAEVVEGTPSRVGGKVLPRHGGRRLPRYHRGVGEATACRAVPTT